MNIKDYLDTEKLEQHIDNGLVTVREHKTLPLKIYSYSRKTVYGNLWDEVTSCTRGLIVDKDGEIVARPYEKFFSIDWPGIETHSTRSVQYTDSLFGPPVITEKVNGHLGILWKYGMHWGVASKGSFHSAHAEFATKWLEDHYEHQYGVFPSGFTPIFEIICQDIQPHTIKYGKDELVLLSMIRIDTGEELGYDALDEYAVKNRLKVVKQYDISLNQALEMDSHGMEGLVATYNISNQPPLKLKIKFPTFIANRKIFYENLKAQKETVEKENKSDLYKEIHNIASKIILDAFVHCTERHEFIAFFNKPENKEYRAICIAILDYDSVKSEKLIWRYINGKN